VFKARLTDKDPYLRRAAAEGLARLGDRSVVDQFVSDVNMDESEMVRAAMAFALLKTGQVTYLDRLIDFAGSEKLQPQLQGYFIELGSSAVKPVVTRLHEPDDDVRRNLATILGAIGDQSATPALVALKDDRNKDVSAAATSAIERLKMTGR
jgi:HEAT repeat protein